MAQPSVPQSLHRLPRVSPVAGPRPIPLSQPSPPSQQLRTPPSPSSPMQPSSTKSPSRPASVPHPLRELDSFPPAVSSASSSPPPAPTPRVFTPQTSHFSPQLSSAYSDSDSNDGENRVSPLPPRKPVHRTVSSPHSSHSPTSLHTPSSPLPSLSDSPTLAQPGARRRPRAGTTRPSAGQTPLPFAELGVEGDVAHHPQRLFDPSAKHRNNDVRRARDEFEEQFLSREIPFSTTDSVELEAQMINAVLDGVEFRQIADDEEDDILSEDGRTRRSMSIVAAAHPSPSARGNAVDNQLSPRRTSTVYPVTVRRKTDGDSPLQHPPFNGDDFDPEFATIDLRREESSSVSAWRNFPEQLGVPGCPGCHRLCKENRSLRRQLDELEFELASTVVTRESITDDLDSSTFPNLQMHPCVPGQQAQSHPSLPHLGQIPRQKGRSWTSRLIHSASLSSSSSRSSERARLKSQVQALSVTTEYLWRKLNKAELELRQFRLREIRSKMDGHEFKASPNGRNSSNHDDCPRSIDDDCDWK